MQLLLFFCLLHFLCPSSFLLFIGLCLECLHFTTLRGCQSMAEEQINIDEILNVVENNDQNLEVTNIFDEKRSVKLLETAWQDIRAGLYTDITVIVENKKFQAHRLVLASLSDYFPPLIKIDEKGSGEVHLQNISPDDFEVLLKYAYTGQLDITLENVQSVLVAADYLSIEFVKNECVTYMESHIDIDNVCDALMFAKSFAMTDMEKNALQFLHENLDPVSTTAGFSKLDYHYLADILNDNDLVLYKNKVILNNQEREMLILEAVLRYLSSRNEDNPNTIQVLLSSVRLPELSLNSINNSMQGYKQFQRSSIVKKYLALREKALQIICKKEEPKFSSLVALASEIPSSWFKPRKLASFTISDGQRRHAAGGEIVRTANAPQPFLANPDFKIQRIEIWTRLWEGSEVIGGMRLEYLQKDGQSNPLEYFSGGSHNALSHHTINLELNEFIIKVKINSGWLIDSLGFETNLGKSYGPYGGEGGGKYEEISPLGLNSYLYDINFESLRTQGSYAIYNLLLKWIAFS